MEWVSPIGRRSGVYLLLFLVQQSKGEESTGSREDDWNVNEPEAIVPGWESEDQPHSRALLCFPFLRCR